VLSRFKPVGNKDFVATVRKHFRDNEPWKTKPASLERLSQALGGRRLLPSLA
jgi:hypothetical protein